MKFPNYSTLDALILAHLSNFPDGAMNKDLLKSEVLSECSRLSRDNAGKPAFRFLDKRLQVLRKAGIIYFNSKAGWFLTSESNK